MIKQLLRITHLDRDDYEDGWYIRFTGEAEAWERLKNELKHQSRIHCRWASTIEWPDGKVGAWYISDSMLILIAPKFINIQDKVNEVRAAEAQAKKDAGNFFTSTRFHNVVREDTIPRPAYIPVRVQQAMTELGFDKLPTSGELKARWRFLALQFHPDMAGTEGDIKFKRVNNAHMEVKKWIETKNVVDTAWPGRSA